MMTDPIDVPQGRPRVVRSVRRGALRDAACPAKRYGVRIFAGAMISCGILLGSVVGRAMGDAAPGAATQPAPTQPAPPPPPPLPPFAPESVERAIAKGKEVLFGAQKNGNWEEVPFPDANGQPFAITGGQWGGQTALATYALMAAGESNQQANVRAAIEWLKKADIKGVYALGMRLQVWSFLPSKEARSLIERDAKLLLQALKSKGKSIGFFDYLISASERYDHSVSQYGVLGVWAAAEADPPFEVPIKFWQLVEDAWVRDQDKSGGWGYVPGGQPTVTPSMTAAGVATLFITQDYLHGTEGIECHGNISNRAIELGLKWMTEHFSEVGNLYTWYGIERIGVASGYKYFGTTDWFKEGCIKVVPEAGKWADHTPIAGTSFALLFLSRGRAPVIMNKLAYEIDSRGEKAKAVNWNQRPRDVANVVRWIGHETERFFNWQIVNLNVPAVELHDAPILYIAGNQAVELSKEHDDKLRQFVEEGGLIVCNADCNNQQFSNSILKGGAKHPALASRLFPNYEPHKLPTDHPILTGQLFKKLNQAGALELWTVGNGSREFMIVITQGDPARWWQSRSVSGKEGFHQIMANIFLYATDQMRGALVKGRTFIVTADPAIKANKALKVARLEYGGNWDPEPGGWRRMAGILHNHQKIDLTTEPVKLGDGKLDGFKIAHLTGNVKFHLGSDQRDEIKRFVNGGGLLIVDACGGSGEFAASAETELAAIFEEDAKQLTSPLKPEAAVFAMRGQKIEEFGYRHYAARMLGQNARPRLCAIMRNGKPQVYYSREDLSVGMVGQEVDGIHGYTPAISTAIMQNILLQASESGAAVALANKPDVAPAPAPAPAPEKKPEETPKEKPKKEAEKDNSKKAVRPKR